VRDVQYYTVLYVDVSDIEKSALYDRTYRDTQTVGSEMLETAVIRLVFQEGKQKGRGG
jgi:hypothetical protein